MSLGWGRLSRRRGFAATRAPRPPDTLAALAALVRLGNVRLGSAVPRARRPAPRPGQSRSPRYDLCLHRLTRGAPLRPGSPPPSDRPCRPARPRRSPARCDVAVRNSRTLSVSGSWSCQFMRKIFFFKLPFFAGGGGFFWKVSHGGGPARRGGCGKFSRMGLKFDLASLVSGFYFGTLVQIFAGGRKCWW